MINDTAPKAEGRFLAFVLRRPVLAFFLWAAAFTGVATSAVWLPRDGEWALLTFLAPVCLTGEAIRWRRRRR